MTTETISTISAITKTQFTAPVMRWLAYKDNPTFGMVSKREDWEGDNYIVPLQTEANQSGGVTIAIAQAGLFPDTYKRFTMTRLQDFAVARVNGEVIDAASSNKGAFVNAFKRAMEGAIFTAKRSAAIHQFRAGTGSRGQISSGSNVSTATVTLARLSDITNMSLGLTVQLANTDGGTLRSSGANAQITKIDRLNGTITFSDVLTNLIAAAQANDFILRSGDLNGVIHGMGAWVPTSTPSNTLFNGTDRSVDPVRLAGQFVNCQNLNYRESLITGMSRIKVENGDPDTVVLNPLGVQIFAKEMEGKSIYFKQVELAAAVKGTKATVGYDAFETQLDGSKVRVISDVNCPNGDGWVTQFDTWFFASILAVPRILEYQGVSQFVHVTNDDAVEIRVGYRGDLGCDGPSYNVHLFNLPT